MSRMRRVVSSLPHWVAMLGAGSGIVVRFQEDGDTRTQKNVHIDSVCMQGVGSDQSAATKTGNTFFTFPRPFLVHCKPRDDALPCHRDSMKSRVKEVAEEIWALLDQHVHRVSGSLRSGQHHGNSLDASIPHPEISVDALSNGFQVVYMVPREVMMPIDSIVRGLQLALRNNQQQNISMSKQETYGSEGRASGIRIQSSEYGTLHVDVLQPFDADKICRLEFRGDVHDGILRIMSDAIAYATSNSGMKPGMHGGSAFHDMGDQSMMIDSMEQMMRMFLERGMMPGPHFGSDLFPDPRQAAPDYQRTLKDDSTSDISIARRLESMGCQVFFPHPDRKSGHVDWGTLAGYEVQKKAIEENLLLPLQKPDVYDGLAKKTRAHYSSNRPRAVLFTGPPGTGKTSSARVIAQQASVPLCYIPLEALASKWYGESEKKLAEALAVIDEFPDGAVLFLDELDSLATTRGSDMHEATRRTLGVLLRHLDGFDLSKKTVVIGATNRPDDLDSALRSRFSATIHFGLPTNECRVAILRQYAQQLSEKDIHKIASVTEGMSGRDLRDICEVAERHWASLIIQGKVSQDSLPCLDAYLTSVHARQHSFGH